MIMLSTITKLNQKLNSSITNLYYFMILLFFTYLIIPTEFIEVFEKLSIYIPILPYTLYDYIQFYQIVCTLTVVTFLISKYALHTSQETIPIIIYTTSSAYTFLLLVVVNGNKLHEDSTLMNFFHKSSILIQNTNPIIFTATLIVFLFNIFLILVVFIQFVNLITEKILR